MVAEPPPDDTAVIVPVTTLAVELVSSTVMDAGPVVPAVEAGQ